MKNFIDKLFMNKMERLLPPTEAARYSWEIDGVSGKHGIVVEMMVSGRWPEHLYVDGQLVKTFEKGSLTLIPHVEYQFECDGEMLTLITHSGVADILHRGRLIKNGLEYAESQQALLLWYRILLLLFNLLSPIVYFYPESVARSSFSFYWMVAAILMAFCCAVLSWSFSIHPLFSKKKKLLFSLLITVGAWAFMYLLLSIDYLVTLS